MNRHPLCEGPPAEHRYKFSVARLWMTRYVICCKVRQWRSTPPTTLLAALKCICHSIKD